MHDEERLAALFLEGHRVDGTTVITFLIRPDEERVRRYFDVPTEERHGVWGSSAENEAVPAIGALLFDGDAAGAFLGAASGAVVGATASQGSSETRTYRVTVRFDDGGYARFRYSGYSPFGPGARVGLTPQGLVQDYAPGRLRAANDQRSMGPAKA